MKSTQVSSAELAIVQWLHDYVGMLKFAHELAPGKHVAADAAIKRRIDEVEAFLQRLRNTQVLN